MSEPPSGPRSSGFLPILLASSVAFFFLFVLVLLTGGYFVYVIVWAGIIGGLGMFHYLLWGRAFEQATAAERKELELLEEASREERRA